MLKKFLVLFLVALLVLPGAAFASDDFDSDSGKDKGKAYGKSHSKDKAKGHEKKEGKKAKKSKKDKKKAGKKGDADNNNGILTAMKRIQSNIDRLGEKAPIALKTVVNKFALWLGRDPVYDIDDQDTGTASPDNEVSASSTDEGNADEKSNDKNDDLK